jgi:hypothetical protein
VAAAIKNTLTPGGAIVPTLVTKLTRGKPANLGTIVAAGDAVAFTVPEPSRDHQGYLVIQLSGGTTPTPVLEGSLDDGATWFTFPTVATTGIFFPYAITGQVGGDAAATFAGQYNVSGHGAGTRFRLGRTDANGGNAVVWALVG